MNTVSDYLFMLSLLLMIVALFMNGVGRRSGNKDSEIENPSGSITDLQSDRGYDPVKEQESSLFGNLRTSYLFWLSLIGLFVSIALS